MHPRTVPSHGTFSSSRQALRARLIRDATECLTMIVSQAEPGTAPVPSIGQQGLLLLEGGRTGFTRLLSSHHAGLCLRVRGPIDRGILERALNVLLQRHRSLAVTFQLNQPGDRGSRVAVSPEAVTDAELFSVCPVTETLRLDAYDLSNASHQTARDTQIATFASRVFHQPFVYGRHLLVRATLATVGPAEHLLLVVMPHAIVDGLSLQVLQKELAAAYGALHAGAPPCFADGELQYDDFAHWQWSAFRSGRFDGGLAYWREQWRRFQGAQLTLRSLTFARAVPADADAVAGPASVELDAGLSERLVQLARSRGTTMFVVLLTAWFLCLRQYSRQKAIAVWGNFANRMQSNVATMVGYVANHHLLGADIADDMAVGDLLAQVHVMLAGAIAHQAVPLPLVWASSAAERSTPSALFSDACVMIDFVSPPEVDDVGPVTFDRLEWPIAWKSGRLKLVVKQEATVNLVLQYSAHHFDPSRVQTVLVICRRILESISRSQSADVASCLREACEPA